MRYEKMSSFVGIPTVQFSHVATTPGADFGVDKTNKYLHFAYTRNITYMSEGIKRLKDYLKA